MEGFDMLTRELLERINDLYDIDDILYIIGRDRLWLLKQIKEDILEHKEDFFQGDEYYSEIVADE